MRIVIVGAGYVGIANAIVFARSHDVCIVDIRTDKVDAINTNRSPLTEPGFQHAFSDGSLGIVATTDACQAYENADYVIVAAPTDYNSSTNALDTSSVKAIYRDVRSVSTQAIFVIRSTVPVGFTARLSDEHDDPCMVFAPEFLREGHALEDCLYPARIVTGGVQPPGMPLRRPNADAETAISTNAEAQAFASLLRNTCADPKVPLCIMSSTEAEAVKLFANSYLAMRVAFFNELDSFTMLKGLDTRDIIEGVCLDPRIGNSYNNPSFGFGGYCLPKDTRQLIATFDETPQVLTGAIIEANLKREEFIVSRILERHANRVGFWRLTMKTDADDLRNSSLLDLIALLDGQDIDIWIHEPLVHACIVDLPENVHLEDNPRVFKEACDLIVCNRWDDALTDVAEKVFTRDVFRRD